MLKDKSLQASKENKMPKEKKKLTEKEETKEEASQEQEEVEEKEQVKEVKKDRRDNRRDKQEFDADAWKPKTELGKKVKAGEIKSLAEILDKGLRILEPEIIDILLPDLEKELLLIGQSKGKFGGGQRRVFRQTQKKTKEGNKPNFATYAVVGNQDGYIGIGYGKGKETVPAREKAFRKAKLNIIKIRRGCGSWECGCKTPHSIPYEVKGKIGSSIIKLMPAPKGKGLVVEKECAKILGLAGIKDVWSKSLGQTKTKINFVKACIKALMQLSETKIKSDDIENLGIIDGEIKEKATEEEKEFIEEIKLPKEEKIESVEKTKPEKKTKKLQEEGLEKSETSQKDKKSEK